MSVFKRLVRYAARTIDRKRVEEVFSATPPADELTKISRAGVIMRANGQRVTYFHGDIRQSPVKPPVFLRAHAGPGPSELESEALRRQHGEGVFDIDPIGAGGDV